MRIRVELDTSKPLCRVVYVKGPEGLDITCVVKYERLSVFCNVCGHIGHSIKMCELFSPSSNPADFQYGSWMRVQILQGAKGVGEYVMEWN